VRAVRRFPYLTAALTRIPTHTVRRLHLEGPDGRSVLIESDEDAAIMIRRVEFDQLLVSLAVEAGAELVTGADIAQVREADDRVELVARDGRRFEAAVLVAADGVHSTIARRLGLNRGWPAGAVALDMMEETPRTLLRDIDPSALWVSYGYDSGSPSDTGSDPALARRGAGGAKAAEGYAYVFPKRDHVNIGVGYVLAHFRESIDEAPYDIQRRFVETLRRRGVTEGASVRANFTPFLIPVGGPLPIPARGRVLLTGDAGGFVNGFTAEGIYYAMVTGDLAARAIAAGQPASLAARYRRACRDEIGAELRDSVLIQRYLFADRRRIAQVIEGAGANPALTRLVLDFASGRLGYAALRRRMLARSPVLAARLLWMLAAGAH